MNLAWDSEVRAAIGANKNTGLAAFQIFLRAIAPVVGTGLLSTLTLTPTCDPKTGNAGFQDLLQDAKAQGFFISGAALLAGPLLEKVIFQLHEIDWHPKDTTLPLEYRKSVHEALTSLTGQFESLIGVIGSVGAINSVLLLDSGNGPVISTTVGAAVNLLIALLANVGMHMSTNAATAYDHFRNDDEKDGDKSLKSMASRSRPFFALAGTLGLGSVVSAATTGMTQYKGTDDKTKWLIGSYIPTLVALYLLGSSLLQMTLQMHRAPGPFIKAKAYAP